MKTDYLKLPLLLLSLFFSFLILSSTFPSPALAQEGVPCLPGLGGSSGCDPNAGNSGSGGNSAPGVGKINSGSLGVPTEIDDIIGGIIQLVYAVAGLVFFFMFLFGGIRYLTAGGDEKAATAARATLTQAVIGLVIIVSAFLITQLVFTIFGISGFIDFG